MADFKFITTPELRQCLEGDYKELQACLHAKAWKAVHVMAGSIVEAVLIDALASPTHPEAILLSKAFVDLIKMAKDDGILSEEAQDLSTVIRKYRNLIHPGKLTRSEKTVDEDGAIVAARLVEIIAREAAKKKQEAYGFTAEQLFSKLSGSTALPLVPHLLPRTSKPEIERLLTIIIPGELNREDLSIEDDPHHIKTCYHTVFDAADKAVKETVMEHFFKVFQKSHESEVLTYEDFLFRGSHLAFLPEDKRKLLKDHFLPRFSIKSGHLDSADGIGPFLTPDETARFAGSLIRGFSSADKRIRQEAQTRLVNEYVCMSPESKERVCSIAKRLKAIEFLQLLADVSEMSQSLNF